MPYSINGTCLFHAVFWLSFFLHGTCHVVFVLIYSALIAPFFFFFSICLCSFGRNNLRQLALAF